MTDPALIWSYLAQGPLLWLTATLVAYVIGDALFRAAGRQSWANPVLIAVMLLGVLLLATGTPAREAAGRAVGTAGSAVVFAGLTVESMCQPADGERA